MFKKYTAILMLLALINCDFSRFMLYAGFKLNQKYIAENLCVNKSRSWMHCNGKCYFMRKIKEAEQKEKSSESQSQKYKFQEAIFNTNNDLRFYSRVLQVMQPAAQHLVLPLVAIPIFQPPPLG